jgi:hypothetical protein
MVVVLYMERRIGFFETRMDSGFSVWVFAAAVMAGAAGLGVFGTFLDTLRSHMFNERSRYVLMAVNELIRITLFGIYIHFADALYGRVELGNALAEVVFTLIVYGFLQLISTMIQTIRARQAGKNLK